MNFPIGGRENLMGHNGELEEEGHEEMGRQGTTLDQASGRRSPTHPLHEAPLQCGEGTRKRHRLSYMEAEALTSWAMKG